ncbi:RNA polymerase recycling motor HelD [Fusibacter ferrireducens]|uniref:UvrD-helicase domain-containing protein n=1 Tax=Fusibacter ferrireducens TaxID=2785058 RepID=A0ABR9ZUD7_9FIRM|nr:RNA polymerase recycling motor HelD [Fusibacter ferrireducens]MBF4694089.1 UvrD-helicase domain-containing protein [Fusibacter ferrireducens]
MNAKEHPDYEHEQEKLAMIQNMISKEREELIIKSQDYGRLAKEVIADPNVLEQLRKIDSNRLNILETLAKKPYFGRVDFCELGKDKESYLIGKTSVDHPKTKALVVLDWRAPLAGIYYSGEIGEVMYNSPEGTIIGDLELKRQYEIIDGELINIFDKGLTPMDEFLQKALWEKKDNRLADIVTTIQDEQNQIIRAPKDGILIIQGVAGSGKTTIVLHRIAYLMYTYQDLFQAEKILMIVPNRLFLDYISDVLPDLGVHDIEQVTFEMLFEKAFGKTLPTTTEMNKLKDLIDLDQRDKGRQNLEYISSFKGSMKLKRIMDHYVTQLLEEALPKTSIEVLGKTLYTYEELETLFSTQYAYMTLAKRKEKLYRYIKDTIEDRLLKLENRIISHLDRKIINIKSDSELDEQTRQKMISNIASQKINYLGTLNESIKEIPKAYLAKWENLNIEKLLLNLLGNVTLLEKHAQGILSNDEIRTVIQYTQNVVKSKIEYEDIPALLYLKFAVEGSELLKKYTHIIVDEAQDFNPLQMHVLTMMSSNHSFTVVGDVAQGINAYRGISNWSELTQQVFKPKATTYKTISICYRSTKEIIDFGNAVISSLNDAHIVLAKPALRAGRKPSLISCGDEDSMIADVCERIMALRRSGYKSVAIMCKTELSSRSVHDKMSALMTEAIQLLTGHEEHYKGGITLLTPQLSKGLEFDAVIILDSHMDPYTDDPLHIKLLYVAVTRALHELFIYHVNKPTELIARIDTQLYEKIAI